MSGHSKWSQIKRQKGTADVKRGQAFTKLSNAISIAVREGNGVSDPSQNFKLRLLMEKAKSINMAKDTIERAIEKGKGGGKGQELQHAIYEGIGPDGVGIMIEAVTDNKARTNSEVRNILEKNGATFATPGAVSYQFQQKGQITVLKNGSDTDTIFLSAADCGAEDIEDVDSEVFVYTAPHDLALVKEALSKEFSVTDAELVWKPVVSIPVSDKEKATRIFSILEKLESLDDVQKVYSNFDIIENA